MRKIKKYLKKRGEGAVVRPFPELDIYIIWWGLSTPTEEELKELREEFARDCEIIAIPCHTPDCFCPQGEDGFPEGEGCVEDHFIILW